MLGFHSNLGRLTFVGVLVLAAACSDSPVASRLTVGPVSFDIVSGGDQSAPANTELPDPLVVKVLNARGHPIRDQIVNFRVVSGGGSVYAGTSLTNSDGIAKEYWTLGASGAQSVEVRAVDPTSGEKQVFATFNATIALPPPPPITADGFEPNDYQGSRFIANLNSGQSYSMSANFHTLTDVDWFQFYTHDNGISCSGFINSIQTFTFTVTLDNVPSGSSYRISLYEGSTLRDSRTVAAGPTVGFGYTYGGICGTSDAKTFDVKVERVSGDPTGNTYTAGVMYAEN